MSRDIVRRTEFDGEEPAGYPAAAPAVNPVVVAHKCLRGHYMLAIVLGLVFACPLAVLGWFSVPPKYTSTGRINIAPTRPYILYENEFTERLSSFESFVQAQANTLQAQRVLGAAAKNPDLRKAGWEALPRGLIDLTRSTSVSVPRGGQDIFIRVTWADPKLAQAATNAILDEYAKIAIDLEESQLQATIDTVEDLREEARRERDEARSRAYQLAEREGTDDLGRRREAKHAEVERIEHLLLDLNLQLLPYESEAPGAGAEVVVDAVPIPVETLAHQDRELATMLARSVELRLQIVSLEQEYGLRHRRVESLAKELKVLETLIEARGAVVRAAAPGPAAGEPVAAQLSRQRARLEALLRKSMEEAREYGKLQLDIDRLREEAERADEKFREADARLESLIVQKRDGQQGRISIEERADTPLAPSTDRRIPLTALGAMGGCGVGVGIVMLVGLLNPRYRYVDDIGAARHDIRMVGAIPEIWSEEPEALEAVAASVHQIRTAIDARLMGPAGALVHVVTSASAGEGKTTLSLRLARSFAGSGKRTLVVDADVVGHQITSSFGLGGAPGFADAVVHGVDPAAAVHAVADRNLHVMPIGRHSDLTPEQVSVASVSGMLERLRPEFGAIVIDTGPVLGSIEAQAVVAAGDEVLLVISRGRGVRLVRMAIDRLSQLGAARLGVVFNRASLRDLERSASVSVGSRRTSSRAQEGDTWAGGALVNADRGGHADMAK